MARRKREVTDPYGRAGLMATAAHARADGNLSRAITAYLVLLANDPDNPDIHRRLAPVYASNGEYKRAWHCFVAAAEGFIKQGFDEKAIAVYVQGATIMPGLVDAWIRIARLHLKCERKADAIRVLLEGRSYFTDPQYVSKSIRLLRCVRAIEPLHMPATLDLARQLLRRGKRNEAIQLLTEVAPQVSGINLREVRRALWNLSPTPAATWRWIRALVLGR